MKPLRAAITRTAVSIGVIALAVWADRRFAWTPALYDFIAHQFYEVPVLASVRRPGAIALVRAHLAILSVLSASAFAWSPLAGRSFRRAAPIFLFAYALRAILWISGGNLPLVPGDSCHYVEIAASILRGEGPVKHYVESYFIEYPEILQGRGILDDWATPLYSYLLAAVYSVLRVVPGESLETTFAVAKGTSFALNLLTLPAVYFLARRAYREEVAVVALALGACLPVHAIYAAMELRESLVALTAVLSVWTLLESVRAKGLARPALAVLAGVCAGLAILARNTSLALAFGLCASVLYRRRLSAASSLLVWGAFTLAVIAPWAWMTYLRYGKPFYTYTQYFQYTFSWTVHHYQEGVPRAANFFTRANAAEIVRTKVKAVFIIAVYSTMILTAPVMAAVLARLAGRLGARDDRGGDLDSALGWIGLTFVVATIANIADITQVAQLGRYYLPLFVLALPSAAASLIEALGRLNAAPPPAIRRVGVVSLFALAWSDPTWAYDFTWLVKPYQLHWAALQEAGDWVKAHPEQAPAGARILTWFPWEFRAASDRTTILLPRSFYPSAELQANRLLRAIQQYRVTHVLWGSFEIPPHEDPETFGPYLERTRVRVVGDAPELFRSSPRHPYPVRLYRLPSGRTAGAMP